MYTYILGVAAMGLVVGMFVGLSDSPVVGILLPLLFTLLAGGSGLYVVLSGDSAKARLLGSSLVAFAITVAVSAVLAANYRVSESLFGATNEKAWVINDVPLQAQFDLFEISVALQMLGIPEEERTAYIKRIKSNVEKFPGDLNAATDQLYKTVSVLLTAAKQHQPAQWEATTVSLRQTRERLSRVLAVSAAGVAVPNSLIENLRKLNCTSYIPLDAKLGSPILVRLDAFYVACVRLIHIADSHPSSTLTDLRSRLENIGANWPESRLHTEKQPLHFENR